MDNKLQSTIHSSGNSDVDVNVHIDTASVAYMYACSLYATKQINRHQFENMIKTYHDLMDQHRRDPNVIQHVRTPVKKLGPPRKLIR